MTAITDNIAKDAAYRILNMKYRVRVPRFATISPESAERIGVPMQHVRNPNEHVNVFVTTHRMLEYIERGAIPKFKDLQDARKVTADITELINDWSETIYQSVDRVNPPFEYLSKLEELNRLLFPQARIGRADAILTATTEVGALERYIAQRAAGGEEAVKRSAITSLPQEHTDAFEQIEKAVESRGGSI